MGVRRAWRSPSHMRSSNTAFARYPPNRPGEGRKPHTTLRGHTGILAAAAAVCEASRRGFLGLSDSYHHGNEATGVLIILNVCSRDLGRRRKGISYHGEGVAWRAWKGAASGNVWQIRREGLMPRDSLSL